MLLLPRSKHAVSFSEHNWISAAVDQLHKKAIIVNYLQLQAISTESTDDYAPYHQSHSQCQDHQHSTAQLMYDCINVDMNEGAAICDAKECATEQMPYCSVVKPSNQTC